MAQRVVSMVLWIVQTILGEHVAYDGIEQTTQARNSRKSTSTRGAVAQSVERLNGIQEVAGAKPAGSKSSKTRKSSLAVNEEHVVCTSMEDCTCPKCTRVISSPALCESVNAVLIAKTTANLRESYLRSLRQYLDLFVRWRGSSTPISDITVEDLDEWFSIRKEAPSSRASNIGRLSSLFSFGVRRRWLHYNPCDQLERPRLDARTPRILTPDEVSKIFTVCRERWPRFLPPLALMTFCGVRPAEVQRLKWSAIDLESGVVRIDGSASKVRARRVVIMKPNAIAWLRLGGDLPCKSHRRFMRRLAKVLGFWEPDILRHTAASYMLGVDHDIGKAATMLGNSPSILTRHYLHLVSSHAAKDFWRIAPHDFHNAIAPTSAILFCTNILGFLTEINLPIIF